MLAARLNNGMVTVGRPRGFVAVIMPQISPTTMTRRKVSSAIVAGNTVVYRPTPETLLCVMVLGTLFECLGYPTGVVNVVVYPGQNAA